MGRTTPSSDCQGIQTGLEKLRMLFLTDYTEGRNAPANRYWAAELLRK